MQSCHWRVLGELNLSVEKMLMPTSADQANGDGTDETDRQNGLADELLSSPIGCAADLDSGFSGSSSASYRSVLASAFGLKLLDASDLWPKNTALAILFIVLDASTVGEAVLAMQIYSAPFCELIFGEN